MHGHRSDPKVEPGGKFKWLPIGGSDRRLGPIKSQRVPANMAADLRSPRSPPAQKRSSTPNRTQLLPATDPVHVARLAARGIRHRKAQQQAPRPDRSGPQHLGQRSEAHPRQEAASLLCRPSRLARRIHPNHRAHPRPRRRKPDTWAQMRNQFHMVVEIPNAASSSWPPIEFLSQNPPTRPTVAN